MHIVQHTARHPTRSLVFSLARGAAQQWCHAGSRSATSLQLRVLRSARERTAIAELRKLAAFGVEQDLGLDLARLEQDRDEIGLVTAVYSGARILVTLRFVPTGYGLTGAERLFEKEAFDGDVLSEGSWEIGRLIMAPDDRHPEILLQCMRVALRGLLELEDVRCFHATTTLAMARLWRRFGMRTVLTTLGDSGTQYALVHGSVEDAAAAMGMTLGHRPPRK